MLKRLCGLVVTSSLLLATAAVAQPAKKSGSAAVRRDPKGVKGISPFMEALKRGDSALIAREFDGAIAAYREAITKEPQNALGHYRVGEAQLAKGDLHEAEEAFTQGLRFAGVPDSALKAKLQFALADLRERQKSYEVATGKWTDYATFTTEQKDAKGFPATATDRKQVIETWMKVSAESVEVKARIEKRLKEADEAVRKSSK